MRRDVIALSVGAVINTVPAETAASSAIRDIARQVKRVRDLVEPPSVGLNVVYVLQSPRYGELGFVGVRRAAYSRRRGLLMECAVADVHLGRGHLLDLMELAVEEGESFVSRRHSRANVRAWREILSLVRNGVGRA